MLFAIVFGVMQPFELNAFELTGAEYWIYRDNAEIDYPRDVLWGFYPKKGEAWPGEEPNIESASPAAIACAENAYAALHAFLEKSDPRLVRARSGLQASNRFYLWLNDYTRTVETYQPGVRPARFWYWQRRLYDATRPHGYWKWESTLHRDGRCETPPAEQVEEFLKENAHVWRWTLDVDGVRIISDGMFHGTVHQTDALTIRFGKDEIVLKETPFFTRAYALKDKRIVLLGWSSWGNGQDTVSAWVIDVAKQRVTQRVTVDRPRLFPHLRFSGNKIGVFTPPGDECKKVKVRTQQGEVNACGNPRSQPWKIYDDLPFAHGHKEGVLRAVIPL